MSVHPISMLLFAGVTLGTAEALAQTPTSSPTSQPQPEIQPALPAPEIGFEFEGVPTFNYAPITQTTYTGDCPGVALDRDSFRARFRSSKTPPGDRRRVIIRNMTTGMAGDTPPYTDREYDKGRLSEATTTEFGTEHSSQRLRVAFGMNTFSYEIRESGVPVESGTFTSNFDRSTRQVVRDAQWQQVSVCANSAVATNVCADLRRQNQLRCPNGNILQREMLDSDISGIRTSFSNQSNRVVRFRIGDDLYRLEPGERIRIRRSSTSNFGLSYNGNCTDCRLEQNTWVTPGKRLRFVDRGRTSAGARVELVDYPNTSGNIEE